MKFSLKAKLSLTIALVVLLTVALISLLSNYFIQNQFKDYITTQQKRATEQIVESIAMQYDPASGAWNRDFVHTIGMYALHDGYIVKVYDTAGNAVWDAETCDMSLCTETMEDISRRMELAYPSIKGEFTTETFPAVSLGAEVGTVSVSYFGPLFFSEEDFLFLHGLNRILLGIGAVSLLISIITGIFLARHLSGPILKTVAAAQDIAHGKYGTRIKEGTGTREVDQLVGSINHLAGTLEKQEALRRQLTADVAHELRTPLTTVQTHVEAMMEGVWEPTRERLSSCYDEMNRLGSLVSDLESLAKAESDDLNLEKRPVSLSALTEKALGCFEKEIRDKNLHVKVEGGCSPVSADGDRISQVLINLVSNAVKYTPRGGEITITLADGPDGAVFQIRDNGVGIGPEELPYIFERFYRADKSRNRSTGGSGIGLAIVKSIVEAHRGTVDVRSSPGKGSNFIITLPTEGKS